MSKNLPLICTPSEHRDKTLKYYDFSVGLPRTYPSQWKYQALKIAAFSPELAVLAKMFLTINPNNQAHRSFEIKRGNNPKLMLYTTKSVRKATPA